MNIIILSDFRSLKYPVFLPVFSQQTLKLKTKCPPPSCFQLYLSKITLVLQSVSITSAELRGAPWPLKLMSWSLASLGASLIITGQNAVGRRPKCLKLIYSSLLEETAESAVPYYKKRLFKSREQASVVLTLQTYQLCTSSHWQCPGGWESGCLWNSESHHTQQLLLRERRAGCKQNTK